MAKVSVALYCSVTNKSVNREPQFDEERRTKGVEEAAEKSNDIVGNSVQFGVF